MKWVSPKCLTGSRKVVFVAQTKEQTIECEITREALEQYFWAPPECKRVHRTVCS
ncbi:DUF1488 family protein [Burkholderia sp. R-69608]|nr:DUF1488 family protein [Burkholderia sp. R-69608]